MIEHLLPKSQLDAIDSEGRTALHHAARSNHEEGADLLLAAGPPAVVLVADAFGDTVLHAAVRWGSAPMTSRLLAAGPALIDARNRDGDTALHIAAQASADQVVACLLAVRPELAEAVNDEGDTPLKNAIDVLGYFRGRDDTATPKVTSIISQILAARPTAIDVLDATRSNLLHLAVVNCREPLAEQLLAIKPDLIHGVNHLGDTILHGASPQPFRAEFLAKLWKLNPDALRTPNMLGCTPFSTARPLSLVVLCWGVSFDDNVRKFTQSFGESMTLIEHFTPVMSRVFDVLISSPLGRDVASTVCEYIGFVVKPKFDLYRHVSGRIALQM